MLRYEFDPTKIAPLAKVEQVLIFSTKDRNTGFTSHDSEPNEPYFDITSLIDEISITENIYSFAVYGHILIMDALNMFEEISVNGQEMVFIKIRKYNEDNSESELIQRYFYVTNMSLYDRQSRKQVYKLDLISPHAMKNLLKRVSRPYGFVHLETPKFFYEPTNHSTIGKIDIERPEHMIWHILTNDLEYPPDKVFCVDRTTAYPSESIKPMKVIIPNWKPFTAIQWLVRNTTSKQDGSRVTFPWMVYETLLGGIRIEPWNLFKTAYQDNDNDPSFWENMGRPAKVIKEPYLYSTLLEKDILGGQQWSELRRKILQFSTGFSFNRYEQVQKGLARSTNAYINPSFKKFQFPGQEGLTETLYSTNVVDRNLPYQLETVYGQENFIAIAENVEDGAPDLVKDSQYMYFTVYNNVLHGFPEDEESLLATKPYNYGFRAEDKDGVGKGGEERYYWQSLADIMMKNSIWMEHRMRVYGDFALNPGIVINISVPKAIDPDLMRADNKLEKNYMDDSEFDKYLSGNYLVTGVTHFFDMTNYYSDCTITRDFSTIDLDGGN